MPATNQPQSQSLPKKELSPKVIHGNDLFVKNGGQFTAVQLRIFLYLLSQLPQKKRMDTVPAICVSVETLNELIDGSPSDRNLFHLRKILNTLASLPATVMDTDGNIILTTWFDYIRISSDGDSFVFQLQEILKPFIMELTGQFAVYQLGYALSLKSSHAMRLYDFLKSIAWKEPYEASLDEIRQYLGLVDYDSNGEVIGYKLPSYKEFNRTVLKPCIDQINEKTDLIVTYQSQKGNIDRRIIGSILFTVSTKSVPPRVSSILPSSRYGKAELVYIDKKTIQADPSKGISQSPHIPAAIFHPAKRENYRILSQSEIDGLMDDSVSGEF